MASRLPYALDTAVSSLRASPGLALLTATTIAAGGVVVGGYAMLLQNLEGLALVWGRSANLTAYIDDGVAPEAWPEVRARLDALTAVVRTELVTPVQALERFRARGPQAAALVEGVADEVLPASVEVHLGAGFVDLAALAEVAAAAAAVDGVGSVDYGQEEFERLAALLELLRYVGLGAGLLVGLATAFIVANTIRLTVYARRDEIIIQRLVGATAGFVRLPFLIEGAVWGTGGGLLAALVLWAADRVVAPQLSTAVADVLGGLDVRLFAADVGGATVIGGALLGIVGSVLAVRRFLDAGEA